MGQMNGNHLWLEVDFHAMERNLSRIRGLMPEQKIMAVVKANGYGLGMEEVARFLEGKVDFFGVNSMEEGIRLREAGISTLILILSPFFNAETVLQYRLTPTIDRKEELFSLQDAAEKLGVNAPFHLKIDTGIHRFGARPEEVPALIRQIRSLSRLQLEGVYSHFAVTMRKPDIARRQLRLFQEVLSLFKREGMEIPIIHMANSEMAIDDPESRFSMVRIGNALYGPVLTKNKIGLERVYLLKGRVLRVHSVAAGEYIGYGATYRVNRPMRIAVLPYGTSEGYGSISVRTGGSLWEKGRSILRFIYHSLFPVPTFFYRGKPIMPVGKPFMNYVLLDVTQYPEISAGSEIEIKPSSVLMIGKDVAREYIGKRGEAEDEVYRERGKVEV